MKGVDWNLLLLGGLVPVTNLALCFMLPTFGTAERNWPAFFAFIMSIGTICSDPPAAHVLMHWAGSAPVFM